MSDTKVLLIYPHLHKKEFMHARFPPLGLEYIAASIRDIADVRILDYRFEKDVKGAVRDFRPDVIGISVLNCVRAHDSYRIAATCRQESAAMIAGGGLHATLCPGEVLDKGFDVVVRGEGERTFRELVSGGSFKDIKGISFMNSGEERSNPDMPLVENPDDLPHPARDLRDPATDYSMNRGLMKADLLSTSRGCPGKCSFCSPAVYYKGRWRAHSPGYVIEELRRIDAEWVVLTDDHFLGSLERVETLCDMIIAEGLQKSFFIQTRLVKGKSDLWEKMVEAGFRMITFGVEGVSQDKVDRYGKGMSVQKVKKFISEWRDAGAEFINGSFVFAHPDDSYDDLVSFGDFAREIDLDFADFIMLTPYPGTRVHDDYAAAGKILTTDWRKYTQGTLLVEHPSLDDVGVRNAKRQAFMRFMSPLKMSRTLELVSNYFARPDTTNTPVSSILKAIYITFLNQHLLFGNHYEASAFEDLPDYGEKEMSRKEMLRVYLRDIVDELPERERDMTGGIRALFGIESLQRIPGWKKDRNISVVFREKGTVLTHLHIEVRDGEIVSAVFDKSRPVTRLHIPVDISRLPVMEEENAVERLFEFFTGGPISRLKQLAGRIRG